MNEQLQKALLDTLNNVTDSVATARDFLAAEIPDVIHQLLLWKFWEAIFLSGLWVVLIGVAIYSCVKAMQHFSLSYQANNECLATRDRAEELAAKSREAYHDIRALVLGIPGAIGFFVALIGGLPSIYCNAKVALQIALAPKLYLIEYAATITKEVAK